MSGFTHERTSPDSYEWYTPPYIFGALGMRFDLDPCSPGLGLCHVPADSAFTQQDDGLAQHWRGSVFVNPPYGPYTGAWLDKLAAHGDGVALVFARTDVGWFQRAAVAADAACFIAGRVQFQRNGVAVGTPGAGSVLFGYGEHCASAVLRCGLGVCVALPGEPSPYRQLAIGEGVGS